MNAKYCTFHIVTFSKYHKCGMDSMMVTVRNNTKKAENFKILHISKLSQMSCILPYKNDSSTSKSAYSTDWVYARNFLKYNQRAQNKKNDNFCRYLFYNPPYTRIARLCTLTLSNRMNTEILTHYIQEPIICFVRVFETFSSSLTVKFRCMYIAVV